MPIYEYRCDDCGHELEKLQKISDPPLRECPDCAQITLTKLVSPAGFRLKGSGWYETDFKNGKKRNLADGGGEPVKAEGKNGADGGSGTDSKKASNSDAGASKKDSTAAP